MARRGENEFDFLGLYIEEINGKEDKSNGAIKLREDSIFIEKRSRLNGKVKDSFEVAYDDIVSDGVDRPAKNRHVIQFKDRKVSLKTIDYEMLDVLEDKLFDIIEGPQDTPQVNQEAPQNISQAHQTVISAKSEEKISEIDIPDQIRKYHDLYKEGIISEEEFENKKKELLSS